MLKKKSSVEKQSPLLETYGNIILTQDHGIFVSAGWCWFDEFHPPVNPLQIILPLGTQHFGIAEFAAETTLWWKWALDSTTPSGCGWHWRTASARLLWQSPTHAIVSMPMVPSCPHHSSPTVARNDESYRWTAARRCYYCYCCSP